MSAVTPKADIGHELRTVRTNRVGPRGIFRTCYRSGIRFGTNSPIIGRKRQDQTDTDVLIKREPFLCEVRTPRCEAPEKTGRQKRNRLQSSQRYALPWSPRGLIRPLSNLPSLGWAEAPPGRYSTVISEPVFRECHQTHSVIAAPSGSRAPKSRGVRQEKSRGLYGHSERRSEAFRDQSPYLTPLATTTLRIFLASNKRILVQSDTNRSSVDPGVNKFCLCRALLMDLWVITV